MKHVVLFSGGPDSLATLFKIRKLVSNVEAIYFDLGHRYSFLEKKICETISLRDRKIVISDVLVGLGQWEEDDSYIWHRNAFLCMAASKFIGAEQGNIYLTVQKDELSVTDRTPEFMSSITNLFKSLGQDISVSSPWIFQDKTDMIKQTIQENCVAFPNIVERLKDTWSCYRPVKIFTLGDWDKGTQELTSHMQCGSCPACFRRWVSFYLNGIEERYFVSPWYSDVANEYRKKAENGEYSLDRCNRILDALSKKDKEL